MKFLILILSMAALFTLAYAVPADSELPYPLGIVQYSGNIGGHEVQLNGTIQEIIAQMAVLYPDFDPASVAASEDDIENLTSRAALTTRNKSTLLCDPVSGWNWAPAYGPDIISGIRFLLSTGRFLLNGRSCYVVSCTGDAQILVCNDNNYDISPAMPYIATYVADIYSKCGTWQFGIYAAGGQEFDTDDYNVIVRWSGTC